MKKYIKWALIVLIIFLVWHFFRQSTIAVLSTQAPAQPIA